MASNDLVECGVCSEGFSEEEHKPLLLPCSHSFCVQCVDGIIQNGVQLCPVCRKKFQASSSEDLPINRGLLDLVKYFRQPEHAVPYKGWRESHMNIVAKSQKTKEKVEKLIQMDGNLIDEVQNISRELKVMLEDNKKLVEKIKAHKEKLENYMTDVEEKEKVIKETQIKLEEATNFTTAGPFLDEVSIALEALWETLSEMKQVMEANRTLLANGRKKHKMSLKELSCIKEILDSAEAEEDGSQICFPEEDGSKTCFSVAGAVGKSEENLVCLTVKEFREAEGDVYAFKAVNGARRFSKVLKTGKDNRTLYIPSLKEQQNLPPKAQFVKYDYLKSLGQLGTYMDLSVRGKPLGRIVITYVNECPYKDYVSSHQCLCSGELGPSFANSNALELKDIGQVEESLVFGDYERNDGTGGKAVCGSSWDRPSGNWEGFSNRSFAIFPHTYSKVETASQFCINIKASEYHCFGYISGGEILQSAAQKFENIREIKISECGVIIK